MPITIRIFLGFPQNSEMKLHLNQSKTWQEAKILGLGLEETEWEGKDYIGTFIPSLLNTYQIKEKEQEIKSQLQKYCPKLNLDRHSSYLISLLFIH